MVCTACTDKEFCCEIGAGNRDFTNVPNLAWKDEAGAIRENPMSYVADSDQLKQQFPCIRLIYSFLLEMEPGARWFDHPEKFGITLKRKTIRDFYDAHRAEELSLGYDTQQLTEEELKELFHTFFSPQRTFRILFFSLRLLLKLLLFWQTGTRKDRLRNHSLVGKTV